MGMPAAAVLATKMILRFAPEVVAMPGIAAGVRGTVEIGDVMVADPAWDYGSGKWVDRDGIPGFETAPHQVGISPAVRTALTLLAEDALTLTRIQTEWQGDPSPTRLQVRIGPVASGAAVLADRENVQRILAQNRKAIGVEMEAYGVYVAAQEAAFPAPEAVAIKAVVDFADATKGDTQQRYGAFVSAASLRHLVERLL
jgi:nucleoside phosphorylase